MSDFYFTFGQKYRQENHPLFGHPDGWIRIQAEAEEQARRKMVQLCGNQWATSYNKDSFRPDYFPRGELALFHDDILDVKLPVGNREP